MRKLTFLLLFFTTVVFAQSPLVLASQQQATPSCTPPTGDVFPQDNAAAYCSIDATTGWDNDASEMTITSVLVDGSYVIQGEVDSGSTLGYDLMQFPVTVVGSGSLDVDFEYRVLNHTGSGSPQIADWEGVTTSPATTMNTDGSWHSVSETRTKNAATFMFKVWGARYSTPSPGTIVQIRLLTTVE